jgi:hypothetical protein
MIKFLVNVFKNIFISTHKVEVEVIKQYVEVLSPTAYARLERQLEPPVISGSDNDQAAAYRLGIQRALNTVRKDFAQ